MDASSGWAISSAESDVSVFSCSRACLPACLPARFSEKAEEAPRPASGLLSGPTLFAPACVYLLLRAQAEPEEGRVFGRAYDFLARSCFGRWIQNQRRFTMTERVHVVNRWVWASAMAEVSGGRVVCLPGVAHVCVHVDYAPLLLVPPEICRVSYHTCTLN